ncbi:MAG TPA: Uma2 family endonuclease [Beijerinckiaceae bacterium]|nr:Uma2 family endonuclease [Beijerinckiaceae bacterium]
MAQTANTIAPMTVEDFLVFTDSRPDDEKWELIDGEPISSPSASYTHQIIVGNLIFELGNISRNAATGWAAIPGIGVRLSDFRAPVPDVLIRPADALKASVCNDMIVAFEVLSPSTADRDLRWKRKAYADLPSLAHYVVIAQDAIEVVTYDRSANWTERRLESADASLDLSALGIRLPLAQIYWQTGLLEA